MASIVALAIGKARYNRCSLIVFGLVFYILTYPLFVDSPSGRIVANYALSLLLVALLWALRYSPRAIAIGLVLALVDNVPLVASLLPGREWARIMALTISLMFQAYVILGLVGYVMDLQRVTTDKVFGAVAIYLLLAFLFATAFSLLLTWQPNAFAVNPANALDGLGRIDMIYFSFTVLTSTGFGEITPATRFARSLIILEQVVGVMYVAFLIARMTNLYPSPRDRRT